jgi:F0F1-type ATP synthase membrane subunit b/b'
MTNDDILNHLVGIEAQAAKVVQDATASANRRIAESEQAFQQDYNKRHEEGVAQIEADFKAKNEELETDYRKQLDEYRTKIDAQTHDVDAFKKLFSGYLGLK